MATHEHTHTRTHNTYSYAYVQALSLGTLKQLLFGLCAPEPSQACLFHLPMHTHTRAKQTHKIHARLCHRLRLIVLKQLFDLLAQERCQTCFLHPSYADTTRKAGYCTTTSCPHTAGHLRMPVEGKRALFCFRVCMHACVCVHVRVRISHCRPSSYASVW